MVSVETLLSYPDWKLPSAVHTDASDKQLVAVISHNNNFFALFYRRLIKPYHNYNTTER